jgi:2,5-diamino-6-(ribosylamino)-4(3H)-pyrimidinone 5'-phosphate reductase
MRPRILYHIGCSLDGRIDWIKPDNFLYYRLIKGIPFDAIISGSSTIKSAEMSTEDNIEKLDNQYLVVVDSQGTIDNWELIRKQAWWNNNPIVLCSEKTPKKYLKYLESIKIEYLIHGIDKVDLPESLQDLYTKYNIANMRIDSGGILAGIMLRQKLVDELSVLISPQITGGTSPKTIFSAPDINSVKDVIDLKLIEVKNIEGDYVWIKYKIIF